MEKSKNEEGQTKLVPCIYLLIKNKKNNKLAKISIIIGNINESGMYHGSDVFIIDIL